jgi:hypothetical protein
MDERFNAVARRLKERSPVDVDGVRFSLSLTEIRNARRHDDSPVEVRILAQRIDDEQSQSLELHIGRDKLNDPGYVADLAVDTLQLVLRGPTDRQIT